MKKSNLPIVHRGEIWYADLSPSFGSEQGGLRPVLVVQNDVGNKYAPTTIIAPITSSVTKKPLPTHLHLQAGEGNLSAESIILFEQMKVIDKQRLRSKIGIISAETIEKANQALKISLGI